MKKLLFGALVAVATAAWAASYTKTDNLISENGGPVAFPAGITVPTTNVGDLHSSTYAATAVAGTNVDTIASPTLQYVEIGGAVIVYGQVSLNTTTDDTASAYTLTLPFTRAANFSGTTEASGFNGSGALETGVCTATSSAKTVTCNYYANGTGTQSVQVAFIYDKT